jgi:hypothetical protein
MSTARKQPRHVTGRRSPMTAVESLAVRVRGEFLEMPGMQLTLPQAQRLWGLDAETCDLVVTILVSNKVLRCEHGVIRRDAAWV